MRPVFTGWFAEFDELAAEHNTAGVSYGRGASRFAGSTYDPTSHYRAARVFAFFDEQGLTPERLRSSYRHQVDLLAEGFDALGVDDAIVTRDRALDLNRVGGFLALRSPHAGALQRALAERGVLTDSRGSWLRLGPAPYLSDEQLEAAIALLGEAVTELR
jgi:kynureninase